MTTQIINIDLKEIPKQVYYLNGKKYFGEICFIDGFNGHNKSETDGMMCALVNKSCWTNGIANILTDSNGYTYHSENRRSQVYNFN